DPRAVRLRPMGTLRATQHRENREVDDPARRPDAPLSPRPTPLWRNRDFVLLQGGQLLSNVGTQLTSIAYPLLVLAVTHSAAKAGIVGFARSIPYPLFGMLAGVAADRWNRKRLMIIADAIRVLALGSLGATILLHRTGFWLIPVV